MDITGDQFGGPEVIVTHLSDARYRPGRDAGTSLALSGKGEKAVEDLKRLWLERTS